VESKAGGKFWDMAADDRQIGDLWEEMSGGTGLFVMVTAQTVGMIDAKLAPQKP
jgi:hypothetical protein